MHLSTEILEAVAQLEIRTIRQVSTLLSGAYCSAFRGSGMQFKEFRHYAPGDDIRHMSWAVTARTGKAMVKTFEEERELDVILVVDVSGSSLFGMKKRKLDVYAELVATLGLAAIKSGDRVALLPFHNNILPYLPPRHSRLHIFNAVTRILSQELVGKKSDLRPALDTLRGLLKHRSLILILSDFIVPPFRSEIQSLSKKHEIILLQCFDDAERGVLNRGIYETWDPENKSFCLLDIRSKETQRKLASFHTELVMVLADLCKDLNMGYLSLSLEDDYLKRLVHFFKRRGPAHI